jgi:hypothetical protein
MAGPQFINGDYYLDGKSIYLKKDETSKKEKLRRIEILISK